MKKLLLVGVCCALPAHAAARVLDSHSDIRVAKSGELSVTERITVEVQESTPGLVRGLPNASHIVDVIRNGHPESYTLDGARLRIGGAPLSPGRHLYQIAYRSSRQIRFLDGHDELRWSLNGAERVTAEVILPAAVPAREIKAEVDTSARGAQGRDYQSFVRDGRAAFRAKASMTIIVRFPKGVVAEPRIDYKGLLLVLAGLGLAAWVLVRLKKLSART